MTWWAHSAKGSIPSQSYRDHILGNGACPGVSPVAMRNAEAMLRYARSARPILEVVDPAAEFHDLGKLLPENQHVLGGKSRDSLPEKHEPFGTHLLWGEGHRCAAELVAAHHAGLKNHISFRKDWMDERNGAGYEAAPASLVDLCLERHRESIGTHAFERGGQLDSGLEFRLALSCLVDADHGDTACNYGQAPEIESPEPNWLERLGKLDDHVSGLCEEAKRLGDAGERIEIRSALYHECRNTYSASGITFCDALVGSGKTTALMAHALRVASEHKLRHVFVVLPFTNIINQAVKVYRDALVLEGENKEAAVAALHHAMEYETPEARYLTSLWKSPVIVTTAVTFFETLASRMPARLRKLHELPGSVIVIDEAHAAIPLHFWRVTWRWLKELTENWGCHVVLASGTLARFWEREEVVGNSGPVHSLLSEELRQRMAVAEECRVRIRSRPEPISIAELVRWASTKSGPRLIIMNTLLGAAKVAKELQSQGREVYHLSTAMTPKHRARVIEQVKERLKNKEDSDWFLVGTSCIEAGLDFSFSTGFREHCSASSLLQAAGRVNRGAGPDVREVWDFRLQIGQVRENPGFRRTKAVLAELIAEERLDTLPPGQISHEALVRELLQKDFEKDSVALDTKEKVKSFEDFDRDYKVIPDDSVSVLVDPELIDRLSAREKVTWRELLEGSISIRRSKLVEYGVGAHEYLPEVKVWKLDYDSDLLGAMAGILTVESVHAMDFLVW